MRKRERQVGREIQSKRKREKERKVEGERKIEGWRNTERERKSKYYYYLCNYSQPSVIPKSVCIVRIVFVLAR